MIVQEVNLDLIFPQAPELILFGLSSASIVNGELNTVSDYNIPDDYFNILDDLARKQAVSYFNKSREAKPYDLSGFKLTDYKGFTIGVSSYSAVLIMGGVIISEMGGVNGVLSLANRIIDQDMTSRPPKEVALDWPLKLNVSAS